MAAIPFGGDCTINSKSSVWCFNNQEQKVNSLSYPVGHAVLLIYWGLGAALG